jgi:hypothetical protein
VGDDDFHPIVEVGETGPLHRRTSKHDDPVVRERGSETVARVGVVRHKQLDEATWWIEKDRAECFERPLRPGRGPAREGFHAFGKRDPEVAGLEASPGLVGRHLGRRSARPSARASDQEPRQDQSTSPHLPSLTLSKRRIVFTLRTVEPSI